MVKKTDPRIRFWKKVKKGSDEQCWPWTGDKTHHGYGRFVPFPKRGDEFNKRPNPVMAHRLAWEYAFGPIPKGLECCHRCDNSPCCNPHHLFLGTHRQNMEDCKAKGRFNPARGEKQWAHKLTTLDVQQIRMNYCRGGFSYRQLSGIFRISKRMVGNIIHRRSWKHVV